MRYVPSAAPVMERPKNRLTSAPELPLVIFHVPHRRTAARWIGKLGSRWSVKMIEINSIADFVRELQKRKGKSEVVVLMGEDLYGKLKIGDQVFSGFVELGNELPNGVLSHKYLFVPAMEPSVFALERFVKKTGAKLVSATIKRIGSMKWLILVAKLIGILMQEGAIGAAAKMLFKSQNIRVVEKD